MPHSLGKLQRIRGNLLDVFTGDIYSAQIEFQDGIITCVQPLKAKFDHYILPGFIDAHIHIESSMLSPSRFAETVVPHGTSAVVADPHEIANVMGLDGINYMVNDAASVPLKFTLQPHPAYQPPLLKHQERILGCLKLRIFWPGTKWWLWER